MSLDSDAYCMASCRGDSMDRFRNGFVYQRHSQRQRGEHSGGLNEHLIELVLLAELHTLFPAVVALEEVGSDSPELNQLVLLQTLSQRDVVKVVVGIY